VWHMWDATEDETHGHSLIGRRHLKLKRMAIKRKGAKWGGGGKPKDAIETEWKKTLEEKVESTRCDERVRAKNDLAVASMLNLKTGAKFRRGKGRRKRRP